MADATAHGDGGVHALYTIAGRTDAQGNAGGDQFRTAPLWGLGQRLFLLHDGSTMDLPEAIADHMSPGSEANSVILNYQALSSSQVQDLLNFLQSL